MENIQDRISDILSIDPSSQGQRSVITIDTNTLSFNKDELISFIHDESPDHAFIDLTDSLDSFEATLAVYLVKSSSFADPTFLELTASIPVGSVVLALLDSSSTMRERQLLESLSQESPEFELDLEEFTEFMTSFSQSKTEILVSSLPFALSQILKVIFDHIIEKNLTNVFIVSPTQKDSTELFELVKTLELGSVAGDSIKIPVDNSSHHLVLRFITPKTSFSYADYLIINKATSFSVSQLSKISHRYQTAYLYTPEYAGYKQEKMLLSHILEVSGSQVKEFDLVNGQSDQLTELVKTLCGLLHSSSTVQQQSALPSFEVCSVYEVNKDFLMSDSHISELLLQKILGNLNSFNTEPNYSNTARIFDPKYNVKIVVDRTEIGSYEIPDILVVALLEELQDPIEEIAKSYLIDVPAKKFISIEQISLASNLTESMNYTSTFVQLLIKQSVVCENKKTLLIDHSYEEDQIIYTRISDLSQRANFLKNGFKPIFCDLDGYFYLAFGSSDVISRFNVEFQSRLVNLLPSVYSNLTVLELTGLLGVTTSNTITVQQAKSYFTQDELDNLLAFKSQVIDLRAISYLVRKLALICFFNGVYEKELGQVKRSILLSMGLQRKTPFDIAKDLGLERQQIEAYARNTIISFVDYLNEHGK